MKQLNLDQVDALRETVDCGSFAAAAARLNLTQPAVVQRIRALEGRYGVVLVRTVGKRILATDAGSEFLARALPVLQAAQAATAALPGTQPSAPHRVTLGSGATACIHLLPAILDDLKRSDPSIDIRIRTGNAATVQVGLLSGGIDLALVTGPVRSGNLSRFLFRRDPLLAVAPRGTRLPRAVAATAPPDLPLILYERGSHTADLIDRWLAHGAGGRAPDPSMELDSTEAIKRLIEAGLGWSILPQSSLSDAAERAGFAVRPLRPALVRDLLLVRPKGRPQNPGVETVWRALRRHAAG
jgi:DNA-binding transcriptional LysR family regulator